MGEKVSRGDEAEVCVCVCVCVIEDQGIVVLKPPKTRTAHHTSRTTHHTAYTNKPNFNNGSLRAAAKVSVGPHAEPILRPRLCSTLEKTRVQARHFTYRARSAGGGLVAHARCCPRSLGSPDGALLAH